VQAQFSALSAAQQASLFSAQQAQLLALQQQQQQQQHNPLQQQQHSHQTQQQHPFATSVGSMESVGTVRAALGGGTNHNADVLNSHTLSFNSSGTSGFAYNAVPPLGSNSSSSGGGSSGGGNSNAGIGGGGGIGSGGGSGMLSAMPNGPLAPVSTTHRSASSSRASTPLASERLVALDTHHHHSHPAPLSLPHQHHLLSPALSSGGTGGAANSVPPLGNIVLGPVERRPNNHLPSSGGLGAPATLAALTQGSFDDEGDSTNTTTAAAAAALGGLNNSSVHFGGGNTALPINSSTNPMVAAATAAVANSSLSSADADAAPNRSDDADAALASMLSRSSLLPSTMAAPTATHEYS